MFKGLLENLESRLGIKREEVGKVSSETLKLHQEFVEARDRLEELADRELSELSRRYEEEAEAIRAKYDKMAEEEIKPLHEKAWEQTYAELGIDPEGEYSMRDNGVVEEIIVPESVKEKMDDMKTLVH